MRFSNGSGSTHFTFTVASRRPFGKKEKKTTPSRAVFAVLLEIRGDNSLVSAHPLHLLLLARQESCAAAVSARICKLVSLFLFLPVLASNAICSPNRIFRRLQSREFPSRFRRARARSPLMHSESTRQLPKRGCVVAQRTVNVVNL